MGGYAEHAVWDHLRQYAEAATEYELLLDEPAPSKKDMPRLVGALVANNYAWANYMLDDPHLLEAADRASKKALARAPEHSSVVGTRGAVLVARGKLAKGRKLLERALRLHRDPHARALTLSGLALASARMGRHREGREFLDRAIRIDRDCELADRADRALSRVETRPGPTRPEP